MKQGGNTTMRRRLGAAALAVGILWVVFATAGSDTFTGAMEALKDQNALPVALLRLQLGDDGGQGWLTTAAALAISQSPLLASSREEVLSLQSQDDTDGQEETTPQQPIRETPTTPDAALSFEDNGVTAKTLQPTTTKGYIVSGLAYINNYSDKTFSADDLTGDFAAALGEGSPQVLIVHTHGSEAYTMPPGQEYVASGESRTTDTNYNVVRVGDEIADILSQHGISVIHDRNMYDYPQYNGAYDRSLVSIENYLQQYPSITFVLDIHRDAISDADGNPYKVISQVPEGTSAQLTFVMGTDGGGLSHPEWLENLKLATAVQNTLLADYPTLMRPITVRNSRYNQHCTAGSMLVEVGAAGNSLDEALLAARLFAHGFAETILAK